MTTLIYTGELVITSCWCGIGMAIPDDLFRYAKTNGSIVYCPLGHTFIYRDHVKAENDRLRRRLEDEEARVRRAREDADFQRRRLAATKGVLTRERKRTVEGMCPVCSTSFKRLRDHIATKHPDYDPATEIDAAKGGKP